MRLFVAINFDKNTKKRIQQVQRRLEASADGSFTHLENMHLTLVFIGEVEESRLDGLKATLEKIRAPKMTLEFSSTGFFKRSGGDIWWIGINKNEELSRLQSIVYEKIKRAGFSLQPNNFKAHITLARRVKTKEMIDKAELLGSFFSATVDSFSLMLSHRVGGRLVYTELENYPKH